MDREVQQLVEMGATAAQARAALNKYKDVMQAAEKFFEGEFENVAGDDCTHQAHSSATSRDPDVEMDKEEDDGELEDDEGSDAYIDYDSDDDGGMPGDSGASKVNDPYAGIFFSKDRREEVIEIEEESVFVSVPEINEKVEVMTQGRWMAGCAEGGEQSFLFSLYSQLGESQLSDLDGVCPCPSGCGQTVKRQQSDFFAIYPKFSTYIQHLQSKVPQRCPKCQTDFCFACGEKISQDASDPLWHCSNLQGVILGVGLFMIERLFEQQKEESEIKETTERETKRRKTREIDDDELDTRSGKTKGGIGYAGDLKEDSSGQAEAQANQFAKDSKIRALLAEVRVYLPSLQRPGGARPSDYLPHPSSLTHLRRRFNLITSELLRNDSLADMSDRHGLYFELLEWLETISSHESLCSMMPMPIMRSVSQQTVVKKTNTSTIRERKIIYEGSASPRELLEAISLQAQAALKGLESSKPPEDPSPEPNEEQKRKTVVANKGKSKGDALVEGNFDETAKLYGFCNRLLATTVQIDRSLRELKGDDFVTRMHESLPKAYTSASDTIYVDAGDTEEDAKEAYVKWATSSRFEYCDLTIPTTDNSDETLNYKHYFNNEIRMLANASIPKRSVAIAKELAILTTNLPVAWDSSIFLRVDDTRVDVIKCLITGPEGTPYHNGCYLFDVFLGANYNQSPPGVKYMTTNGGKYRFNPNLYADGKVCLSLLGTWTGPGWVPFKSTLLQVLLSIQSMILCEEPYLNEPGWASNAGTPQSKAYSANVRRMVVKTAMLDALQNPPEPFEDVIRTHFRLKARSLKKQLDSWLKEDDHRALASDGAEYSGTGRNSSTSSSNDFKADINSLKSLLNDL
ncbi:ubiquitin conjugating enzyme family protein [Lentinula edodes]|uniref:Ubiquitin conjugating enzyme family protein n=1 Tax=Lentinula lateritia TaxID=40482 RepID=A0A9W9DR53_9AGAR|nr:ubiquitin conjugating enzyme family protein [Lentinula edodes]